MKNQGVTSINVSPSRSAVSIGVQQPTSDDVYESIWPRNSDIENRKLPLSVIIIIIIVVLILSAIFYLLVSILMSWGRINKNLLQRSGSSETPSSVTFTTKKSFFRIGGSYKHVMDSSAHNPMVTDEDGTITFESSTRGVAEVELAERSHIYGTSEEESPNGQITVEFNQPFSGLPMSFVAVKQED